MKFCPKCGAQLAGEAAFCDKCGANLSQTAAAPQAAPAAPVHKEGSGLGIAALVLSIIGFLTGFLGFGLVLDVIAIVLAALVLVKAKKQPIKTGTATGGLIVAILSIVLCGVILGPGLMKELNVPAESEMLTEARSVDFRELAIEKYENDAAYVEKYDGEILKVSGYVTNIDNDFGVTISWRLGNVYTFTEDEIERMGGDEFFAANWDISVEFADESVMQSLKNEEVITVVGVFNAGGINGTLEHAYLVTG